MPAKQCARSVTGGGAGRTSHKQGRITCSTLPSMSMTRLPVDSTPWKMASIFLSCPVQATCSERQHQENSTNFNAPNGPGNGALKFEISTHRRISTHRARRPLRVGGRPKRPRPPRRAGGGCGETPRGSVVRPPVLRPCVLFSGYSVATERYYATAPAQTDRLHRGASGRVLGLLGRFGRCGRALVRPAVPPPGPGACARGSSRPRARPHHRTWQGTRRL